MKKLSSIISPVQKKISEKGKIGDLSGQTLFIEPIAGISGNMMMGALFDCGVPVKYVEDALRSLKTKEKWTLELSHTERHGIAALHVEPNIHQPGREQHSGHGRRLDEICWIISAAERIPAKAREHAMKVFEKLAEAEGAVHGCDSKNVHFHEVGALDAIIDICGVSIAIDMLNPKKIISTPPPLGNGFIKSQHGVLPVPAPATLRLMHGHPVSESPVKAELTTPTGAALLTYFTQEWGNCPSGKILSSGYGAGSRKLDEIPNLTRVSIIEDNALREELETVAVLESNLDDFSGEAFSWLGPLILEKGALDYAIIHTVAKKSRPGIILQIICKSSDIAKFAELILSETSSLGVRFRVEKRFVLKREIRRIKTPYGMDLNCKIAFNSKGEIVKAKPEADDCSRIAKKSGNSFKQIHKELSDLCKKTFSPIF